MEKTYKIKNKMICRWNNNGNYWYPIAKIIDNSSCNRLVRMSEFANDVENLTDKYIEDIMSQNRGQALESENKDKSLTESARIHKEIHANPIMQKIGGTWKKESEE